MVWRSLHTIKSQPHFLNTNISMSSLVQPDPPSQTAAFTGTKLLATTGPSCQDVATLQAMLLKGVAGMRLDLTWGPLEFHKKTLENLQTAMLAARRMVACIVDTHGREITIRRSYQLDSNNWPIHEQSVEVTAGQTVVLSTRVFEDHQIIDGRLYLSVTYDKLPRMVRTGDKIWISRYLAGGSDTPSSLYLDVAQVSMNEVVCTAQNSACLVGLLTVFHAERSQDGLENIQNDLPILSDYDKACLKELCKKFEIEFISLSYTKTTQDVLAARVFLDEIGMTSTRILAKIEVRHALLNFGGILNASDGIILSRGNLGLDCLPEKMALLQKASIQACNMVGKPVLVTRFMDSMINNPRPTRAEVTDAANAVLDGVDGILLGAETVRGSYPLATVEIIFKIAHEAEKVFDYKQYYDHLMQAALDMQQLDDNMADDAAVSDDGASDFTPRILSGPPEQFWHDGLQQPGEPSRQSHQDLEPSGLIGGSSEDDEPFASLAGVQQPLLANRSKSLGSLSQVVYAMNINSGVQPSAPQTAKPPLAPRMERRITPLGRLVPSESTRSFSLGPKPPSRPYTGLPFLSKMESIASSAVRVAEKVRARLIVVFTHTTTIAQLLSKYRPPMPILTLIVPKLVSDGLSWRLEGRSHARQCLLIRGVLPMLAAPTPGADFLMDEAVATAVRMGLALPLDYLVCVERLSEEFCVKVVAVDENGQGVKRAAGMLRVGERGSSLRQRTSRRLSVVPPNQPWSPPAMGVASTRAITAFGASTITPRACPWVGTSVAPWLEADSEEEEDTEDLPPDATSCPLLYTMSLVGNRW